MIINVEGHQNSTIGLKVTAVLLNGWIFPIGGVASEKVCACSLHSRIGLKIAHVIVLIVSPLASPSIS